MNSPSDEMNAYAIPLFTDFSKLSMTIAEYSEEIT
jgi:hypothetical protein